MKRCRTLMVLIPLVLSAIQVSAQNDSLAPGVLKVRRAPVPAQYSVQISYQYSAPRRFKLFHGRQKSSLMLPEGEFYSPQPVSIPERPDDTLHLLEDSTFLMRFYDSNDRPAGDYEWTNWLNQTEHSFSWNDSGAIDSCTFVYFVKTNGRVQISQVIDSGMDSSSLAMQRMLWPYMRKLWLWYPAVQLMNESGRQHKVNCTVRVRIYAVSDEQQIITK